ncbi:unnamed protein product [Ectocarpus sp. CCAP 1310/34]|nr:unnamed protein product [Ectocarpus sp. CCAP 1310/34]
MDGAPVRFASQPPRPWAVVAGEIDTKHEDTTTRATHHAPRTTLRQQVKAHTRE